MPLLTVQEVRRRLAAVFAEGVSDRARLSRELAAKTVLTFLFVRAVGDPDADGTPLLRPSMVTWMDDASLRRSDDDLFVRGWHAAASRRQAELAAFLAHEGVAWSRWYADNSREPIRDEIIRPLSERYGAVLRRRGVAASDASPALTLAADFAALFGADLSETDFAVRATAWQQEHLGSAAQARLDALRKLDANADSVIVSLPGRGNRHLPPGMSSALTAAVVTEMAPRMLRRPYPLAICHSRDPVASEDTRELERVGLALDRDLGLPDVMLLDADDASFWFVEVVVSGGPIHETRRRELIAWAVEHGVPPARCRFVTVYRSRAERVFRETVGGLAWNSLVWFADEPDRLLRLDELGSPASVI